MKWSGVRVHRCDALASCSPSHLCLRPFGVVSVLVVGLEANVTSSPHLSVGEVPISSTRLTLEGSGRGVEGLTSGRPDPRLAEASNEEYDDAI